MDSETDGEHWQDSDLNPWRCVREREGSEMTLKCLPGVTEGKAKGTAGNGENNEAVAWKLSMGKRCVS